MLYVCPTVWLPPCAVIFDLETSHVLISMLYGLCERFNRTLMDMLGTLTAEQKSNWKDHIHALVHAYNATMPR